MAARRTRTKLDEKWRDKIRTSMLINRLQDNAIGKIELTREQIRSIEILLKKSAPDLQSIELSGEGGGPLQIDIIKYSDAANSK